ncbi:MAG TPA: CHASE4 domain-containing protein, partial [Chitinivibrionales bacterium]
MAIGPGFIRGKPLSMTLRVRTQLIIGFTLLGLLCVLFTVVRFSLQRGFSRVEQKLDARFALVERGDTHKNIQRAVNALSSCVDNLASKNADWAQWDDTYRYVEDLNAHYARSNLTDQALSALKINYMGIVNTSGRILFSFAFDLVTQKSSALAPGVERRIIHEYGLLRHADPHGLIAGIVETQQGLMIAASRPIVTSAAQGPIRGTIIFGQFLNDSAIAGLSRITHQDIDIALMSDTASTDDFKRARGAISLQGQVIVQAPNSDSIFGYTALRDVRNKPVALVRVGLPREIYRQGRQTLLEVRAQGRNTLITVLIGVSVAGVVLGAIILIILELQVLSRLKRLSMSAGHIGDSKDFSARITVEGIDELASVSLSMNRMLDSLAQTHHQLKRRTTEMHLLMASVPVGLLSLDERLLVNPEYSHSAESILGRLNLAGRRYIDVLGLSPGAPREEDGAKCEEFLNLLCKEALPEKEMAALNPLETLELTSGSKPTWIHLNYHLIRRGGGDSNHILVVMEDISEAKSLEEEVIRSQQENLQLKAIVEEPELFREFIAEAKTMVTSARRLASSLTQQDSTRRESAEIFRLIHTIKGIAGAFALRHITRLAGNTEECLSSMRNHATPQTLTVLHDNLSMLEQAIDEVKKLTSSITGDDADEGGGMSLRISL